jgi:prevent-host-death family protein
MVSPMCTIARPRCIGLTRTTFVIESAHEMKTVSVHQAKAHFSRLVEEAATGNEIVIAKFGKPVAKLVPIRTAPRPRIKGRLKGKITVEDSFFEPFPEAILDEFEGKTRA